MKAFNMSKFVSKSIQRRNYCCLCVPHFITTLDFMSGLSLMLLRIFQIGLATEYLKGIQPRVKEQRGRTHPRGQWRTLSIVLPHLLSPATPCSHPRYAQFALPLIASPLFSPYSLQCRHSLDPVAFHTLLALAPFPLPYLHVRSQIVAYSNMEHDFFSFDCLNLGFIDIFLVNEEC